MIQNMIPNIVFNPSIAIPQGAPINRQETNPPYYDMNSLIQPIQQAIQQPIRTQPAQLVQQVQPVQPKPTTSKEKIKGVLYIVKENDEPEFVKSIIDLGINIQIATKLSNEQLLPKRINYMDIGLIGSILEKDFKHCVGKKFRSSKYLVSEGKIYPSTAYFRKNMTVPNFDQHSLEFLNEEDDKIETDFFHIFEP